MDLTPRVKAHRTVSLCRGMSMRSKVYSLSRRVASVTSRNDALCRLTIVGISSVDGQGILDHLSDEATDLVACKGVDGRVRESFPVATVLFGFTSPFIWHVDVV
jgi:hypothetical protein